MCNTAVLAEEAAVQPEGTTDNDIYGLDSSAQFEKENIASEAVSLSFDDVEELNSARRAEFLVKLGFMTVTDGKLRPKDSFTRYDMSLALQRITAVSGYSSDAEFNDVEKTDERYAPLAYAYDSGFISRFNDYTIRPDDDVSSEELLYAMLCVMGYRKTVEAVNEKGTDGVLKTAKSSDLLYGITYKADKITRAEAVEFLYNALKQPVNDTVGIERTGENDNYELAYEKSDDKTLLSVYHGIYIGEGRVNATFSTALRDFRTTSKNELLIEDTIYTYTDVSMLDFFGYSTEFYYKEMPHRTRSELVYMLKAADVKELTVGSEDIISYDDNVITYFEKNKKRTAAVTADFELIKNGKSVKECLPSEVLPSNGSVTLVANSGGKYDTMLVWEYYNAVAEGISADGTVLKLALKHGVPTLEYDIENVVIDMFDGAKRMDASIETSYYYDGDGVKQTRVTLPSVQTNSLLSIFADKTEQKDGRRVASKEARYIRVVVNNACVEGTIDAVKYKSSGSIDLIRLSRIEGDKVIAEKYEAAEDNFLSKADKKLECGAVVKLYLDYMGKIAACIFDKSDDTLRYGYLIDAKLNGDLSPKLTFKILTEKDEIIHLDGAKRIRMNGVSTDNPDNVLRDIHNSAKLLNAEFTVSQMIKYAVNPSGLLTELETVTDSLGVADGYEDSHLNRENERKNMVYQTGWGNAFVEYEYADYLENGEQKNIRLEMTHYVGEPEVFFCVPETETLDNDKLFSANDGWPSESTDMFPTELYDVSDTMTPGAAVVYAKMQNSYLPKPIVVVDRIFYKQNAESETQKWISGYAGAGGYVEYPADEESVLANVRVGDVIFASGRNNEIYETECMGNVIDIAKSDIADAPLMIKSKNKAPETDFYLYTTLYEAYDFGADTKTLVLQRGNITDGAKREYQRASWWVSEWRKWGGAVTVEVDTDTDYAWFNTGTYGDIKNAYDYSNEEASKILLIENYGYGMRFVVIINKV